jgi:hypothetical protein
MRVETNLPHASEFVSGVHFAKVADGQRSDLDDAIRAHAALEPLAIDHRHRRWTDWDAEREALAQRANEPSPWLVSEEIAAEIAARFLRLPDFREAKRTDEELAAADAELGKVRSSSASPSRVLDSERTVDELTAANLAISADLTTWRDRALAAEKELSNSKLPPSEQVRELTAENKKLRADLAAQAEQVKGLQLSNEAMHRELTALREGKPAAPAPAATRARRASKGRRKAARRAKPAAPATEEPSGLAAVAGI